MMRKCMYFLIGSLMGMTASLQLFVRPISQKKYKAEKMSAKHHDLYMLMNDWVYVKQQNKSLTQYFEKHKYNRIAIYGINYVGLTLLSELQNSDVEVVAGIDQNVKDATADIRILKPNEFAEDVDAIVVTPITFFGEIADMLESKNLNCPIISIKDIVFETMQLGKS